MPYIKLLAHIVWTTKERKPLMSIDNKNALCRNISENAKAKNIYVLNINGYKDHLHALISMSAEQNIATIMKSLKRGIILLG